MYNTKIRFDGDIIITDPCYIVKSEDNPVMMEMVYWWDYYSKAYKQEDGTYYLPTDKDYPDAIQISRTEYNKRIYNGDEEMCNIMNLVGLAEDIAMGREGEPLVWFSQQFKIEKDKFAEAEKAYRIATGDDWMRCEYGECMNVLGFKTWLTDDTHVGDWSCTVFRTDKSNPEEIGNFCADSGMVGVFLLDEVLKYNPKFNDHINNPEAVTWIKDFHGDVELCLADDGSVNVVGIGNIRFYSRHGR